MIKEIENKENILSLKNSLDKFLDNSDCRNASCENCIHDRLCSNIYRLNTTLRTKYLKKIEEDEKVL